MPSREEVAFLLTEIPKSEGKTYSVLLHVGPYLRPTCKRTEYVFDVF
jgi:hypothetical protein